MFRNGDWGFKSPLWTSDAKREFGYNEEEDDGTIIWMGFNDFINNFKAVNICNVKNWQELRMKGRFVRVPDGDNPNVEIVISKWYYNIEISEPTQIVISLHQEDERIEGVLSVKPYLDVGILILKKSENSIELDRKSVV